MYRKGFLSTSVSTRSTISLEHLPLSSSSDTPSKSSSSVKNTFIPFTVSWFRSWPMCTSHRYRCLQRSYHSEQDIPAATHSPQSLHLQVKMKEYSY